MMIQLKIILKEQINQQEDNYKDTYKWLKLVKMSNQH